MFPLDTRCLDILILLLIVARKWLRDLGSSIGHNNIWVTNFPRKRSWPRTRLGDRRSIPCTCVHVCMCSVLKPSTIYRFCSANTHRNNQIKQNVWRLGEYCKDSNIKTLFSILNTEPKLLVHATRQPARWNYIFRTTQGHRSPVFNRSRPIKHYLVGTLCPCITRVNQHLYNALSSAILFDPRIWAVSHC